MYVNYVLIKVEETMSINRWVDEQTVVHPCNEVLVSDKKKWTIKPGKGIENP